MQTKAAVTGRIYDWKRQNMRLFWIIKATAGIILRNLGGFRGF
jgi:hypothetical protein